jgi:hypothetical protein
MRAAPAPVAPPAPAAAPIAPPAPGAPALGERTSVRFWVIDDGVAPGQEYQYRVRVLMYNPTYRWPHALQDPKMKEQETIASDWTLVPAPVTVQSSQYFFITGGPSGIGGGVPQRINARVFRWKAGIWYMTEVSPLAGMPIIARDMKVGEAKEDVDTGHTLIDVVPNAAGNDVAAVLMNSKGELITRDARADRQDPKMRELINAVQAARPAVTRPAPRTPTTPTTPPPNRNIPWGNPVDPRNPDM